MIMDIVPPAEDINARSKSIRSGKVSLWKSERDARGHAVPSLRRCSARQRTVSIKVRENEEVKIAAGNRPRVTPNVGHPPLGFQRYVLPFRDFALTSRGRLRHHQRGLDGAVSIEAVGFTLMDGVDGDFRFDLVSLRAVNVLGGEVVGSVEDERREEEFQDKLLRSSTPSSTKKEGMEE